MSRFNMIHLSIILLKLFNRLLLLLAFVFVLLPMVLMLMVAFSDVEFFTFPPEKLSFRWFKAMLDNRGYMTSIVNSLELASVSAVISTLVSIPAALALRKGGYKAVETVIVAPLFFPTVIWSLGLLQLYGVIGIRGTFVSLTLAHSVMIAPFIFRIVFQSLGEMNSRFEEAAHSLGATKWMTFRRITLPLILPGVIVGAVFGFLISFTDVTLTAFISSSGDAPFPVRVYSEQRTAGLNPIVLVWSTIITVVIFIISIIGEKFARWSRYF
ncbi:ABC transporter permease [Paenibacillus piri]|uniref:ABC transporter permease n=1 Tax=Paenibacillus piri TaxID=2547395 RepID=A0A4R5KM27_9BACL|nr:ABC transporter permease [Paenibacillus piri]TDF95928.1 ABC transporter permease [Paenibacillus piri]